MPFQIYDTNNEMLDALNDHNKKEKVKRKRIAPLIRNAETGWPMMQIGLFLIREDMRDKGHTYYEPALGGGKCHAFNFPMFGFMELMAKVSDAEDVSLTTHNLNIEADSIGWPLASNLLNGFKFHHKAHHITCATDMGGYGLTTKIMAPDEENGNLLEQLFDEALRNIFKEGCRIKLFDPNYKRDIHYSEAMMWDAINQDLVIIRHGQIFVDLGKLFDIPLVYQDKPELRTDLRDYFAVIFQVENFLKLAREKNWAVTDIRPVAIIEKPQEAVQQSANSAATDQIRSTSTSAALSPLYPLINALDSYRRELALRDQPLPSKSHRLFKSVGANQFSHKQIISTINHIVATMGGLSGTFSELDAKIIRHDETIKAVIKPYIGLKDEDGSPLVPKEVEEAVLSKRAKIHSLVNNVINKPRK